MGGKAVSLSNPLKLAVSPLFVSAVLYLRHLFPVAEPCLGRVKVAGGAAATSNTAYNPCNGIPQALRLPSRSPRSNGPAYRVRDRRAMNAGGGGAICQRMAAPAPTGRARTFKAIHQKRL